MSKLNHAVGTHDHRVMWWCPGCNDLHQIPVTGLRAWGWNESDDAPTFTPSVLVYERPALDDDDVPITTPRCHVFITDGVIDYLSDCTHALAGQKVPMVNWRGYSRSDYRPDTTRDGAGEGA